MDCGKKTVARMFCLSILFVALARGEGEGKKPFDLDEIIVTGTPVEKEVKESPLSVTVIDREEIEESKAKTLFDVLAFVPGIFVHRTGDFGRTDPEIRGIGDRGRKIAILIDGVPVKMSLYGCSVTHALPLANVERIEVIRGPNSVLYGSDAVGGVINIITRRMADDGFRTGMEFSAGTHNTFQTLFSHGGKKGRLDYFLTSDKIWSDGHRKDSEYLSSDYTVKLGYALDDNRSVTFFGKYFRGKQHDPGPLGGPPQPDIPDDYERSMEYLSLSERRDGHDFSVTLSHNYGHHRLKDGWRSRDNIYGAGLSYTTFAFENNEMTLGADFRFFEGTQLSGVPDSWERHEYGAYLWNKHRRDRLSVILGGRYQHDSVAGGVFCPQAGIIYDFSEKGRLRGQVSKAFRFPAINDLFMFPPSNKGLKPEQVWNYEAGLDAAISDWLSGSFSVFIMEGRDLIETVANPGPPPPVVFQNAGDFLFKGMEAGLEAEWEKSKVSLYYTYLDPGEYTRGRPGNKIDLIHRCKWSGFTLRNNIQHVSCYYAGNNKTNKIDNFLVVNSRLSYDINKNFEVFIGADNIFDEDYLVYSDLPGSAAGIYPMAGRTFTAGIKAGF